MRNLLAIILISFFAIGSLAIIGCAEPDEDAAKEELEGDLEEMFGDLVDEEVLEDVEEIADEATEEEVDEEAPVEEEEVPAEDGE